MKRRIFLLLSVALLVALLVPVSAGTEASPSSVTEFSLSTADPTASPHPEDITLGPDGNLWFTEVDVNKIGRITPAGVITEFTIPILKDQPFPAFPEGITTGPDGNLWFAERDHSKIGRITPAGVIAEYRIPTTTSPTGITAGPDKALWFTEFDANQNGRITTKGVVTEFDMLLSQAIGEPGAADVEPAGGLSLMASDLAGRPVTAFMTTAVEAVDESTPLDEVARLLLSKDVKRVPVVRDGLLVGIVSRSDLMRALANKLGVVQGTL